MSSPSRSRTDDRQKSILHSICAIYTSSILAIHVLGCNERVGKVTTEAKGRAKGRKGSGAGEGGRYVTDVAVWYVSSGKYRNR